MNHRHLLPNEIDLLVDGESGFGVAPLRAHLAECEACRGRHDALQELADSLERLPHFAPKLRFSDQVIAKVQIVEPWHVALLESARRLVPASTPMRLLAGVGAAAMAVAVSGSAVWLAFRADLASWAFNVLVDRGRTSLAAGAGEVAARTLGSDVSSSVATGSPGALALTAGILATVAVVAAFGFRRLAATARATRS